MAHAARTRWPSAVRFCSFLAFPAAVLAVAALAVALFATAPHPGTVLFSVLAGLVVMPVVATLLLLLTHPLAVLGMMLIDEVL